MQVIKMKEYDMALLLIYLCGVMG